MTTDTGTDSDPVRRDPRPRPGFAPLVLAVLSLASSGMLIAAMPNLIAADGLVGWAKLLLIGISAAAVGYAVNRLAIERGAPLTAVGYVAAGIASVVSILLVGAGLFAATYAGFVMKDVDELRLQQHGAALARYVGELDRATRAIDQATPILAAIVGDLKTKSECEVGTSCVSGRRDGGRGPVARLLAEKLGRAEAVAAEVDRGRSARKEALRRLSDLLGRTQGAFAHDGNAAERRREIAAIDVGIRQAASDLEAAAPVVLLRAYAAELVSPADAGGSPRLAAILREHGAALAGLGSAGDVPPYPGFPPRAGVSDTLLFIPHFLPIAAVTMVVELVFPLTLWVYTLLALVWTNYRREPPKAPAPVKVDPFHGLLDMRRTLGGEPAQAEPVQDRPVRNDPVPLPPARRGRPPGSGGKPPSQRP